VVDGAERAEALAELLVCLAFVVDGVEGYLVRGVADRADEDVEGTTGGPERRATRERPSPQGGQVRRRVRAEQETLQRAHARGDVDVMGGSTIWHGHRVAEMPVCGATNHEGASRLRLQVAEHIIEVARHLHNMGDVFDVADLDLGRGVSIATSGIHDAAG
jgi:hypothetical protein